MNKTEADLKLAIATIESVEQHLDVTRNAIFSCRDIAIAFCYVDRMARLIK